MSVEWQWSKGQRVSWKRTLMTWKSISNSQLNTSNRTYKQNHPRMEKEKPKGTEFMFLYFCSRGEKFIVYRDIPTVLETSQLHINTTVVPPKTVQKATNRSNGFQITVSQNKAQNNCINIKIPSTPTH